MPAPSYAWLISTAADFLNRQDLNATIPTFIALAESGFNRSIRSRKMLGRSTANLINHFTTLPEDFLEAKNVQLNTTPVQPLEYVSLEMADDLRQSKFRSVGKPQFYTIVGDTIEVVPVPDGTYQIELTYYKRIPRLSNSATSNWLLELNPDLYLYGTLVASAPYLKEDERLPMWAEWTKSLIAALNDESDRAERSGSILKIRQRMW
jgi:hypothetical protein